MSLISIFTNHFSLKLKNKNILVISPQNWGTMYLSKHHYSIELARRGNKVFFLNPPDQNKELPGNKVIIKPSGVHENLFVISHRSWFPFRLKFHWRWGFDKLMRTHIAKIKAALPVSPDIVWSFDIGNILPLKNFPDSSFKVFHPVDEPLLQEAIDAAEGAQVIFSVTREIISKYHIYDVPRHFVHHGVAGEFVRKFEQGSYSINNPLRVGYAGNMMRQDIDRSILLRILRENPDIVFNFFGSYKLKDGNLGGGADESTIGFMQALEQLPNVKLHGVLDQEKLAKEFATLDAFLICYDIKKDPSRGTNYHKLMEYFATGRVVISNNITTYNDRPDLIMMTIERDNNESLPALFKSVVANIEKHNRLELQEIRKKFAASNTYCRQMDRIEGLLEPVMK